MKIFITTFYHDGQPFEGPKIYAENLEVAELIAEVDGYIIMMWLVQGNRD
jgi:hypothetical protein